MTLSDAQFDRTRWLALRLAGIELVERHRELLSRRGLRLGIRDNVALDALLSAAERGEPGAVQKVICLLTTKFTGFFRHPRHIDEAATVAVRAAESRGRARLWSAGAATGEEPYSLAMALIERFGSDEPPVQILATDVDVEALAAAQQGHYNAAALQAIEPERRARFFHEATSRHWAISPAVRELVEFQALNLSSVAWPIEGPFDVIFCRNVLMYLDIAYRLAIVERLASILAPDGLLVLDPAEHLGQAGGLFTPRGDGMYSFRLARRPGFPSNSLPVSSRL